MYPINQKASQSANTLSRNSITVKKSYSLDAYKEIVYLTRDYYKAIKNNSILPKTQLPDLNVLIEASTIVNAYLESLHVIPSLRLYNATLDHKTIVAVWMFANEPNINVKLGKHQMFVIKHN